MRRRIATVLSVPSARRLVTSLRDLGYDFSAAVADIVDNSVAAGATRVDITIRFDGDDSWVRIADNGNGMSLTALQAAMRYGAERDYEETDLGRFGLGLKTASLSQCRRLTVASRHTKRQSAPVICSWDIEHIEQTDAWELLTLEAEDCHPELTAPLRREMGTVVFWERLDRILGYQRPYGEHARKMLLRMCRDLEQHLAMVFHRFLDGEGAARKIAITINDNSVHAWDPFARTEKHLKAFSEHRIPMEYNGQRGIVSVVPYVLPHQARFSSAQAAGLASGPLKWNRQQGFYIYRAGRMIQSGGWSRLRTLDEHTKLARVSLSFPTSLDAAFKINVAKMRVQLPSELREQLEMLLTPVLRAAQTEYRNEGARRKAASANGNGQSSTNGNTVPARPGATPPPVTPIWNSGATVPGKPAPAVFSPPMSAPEQREESPIRQLWSIDELQKRLADFADENERQVLTRLFIRLKQGLQETSPESTK